MSAKALCWTAWLGVIFSALGGQADAAQPPAVPVGVFDTGVCATAPLTGDVVANRAGWALVPEDQTRHTFQGDAVLANHRLAVVLRRHSPGAEVYANGAGGPVRRAVLTPVADTAPAGIASIAIVENGPGGVALDAGFRAPGGADAIVRFELQPGQVFVRTVARRGVKRLSVESPCRFAVLPDFFADDIAIDATELPADRAELPSENFLLHMAGHGEAIVLAVWSQREEEIQVVMAGRDKSRVIRASEIPYGAKQQKEQQAEVEQALVDVVAFVRHIRTRIEAYAAFGRQMHDYLEQQKRARPELAGFLGEIGALADRIEAAVSKRRNAINTPEYATRLADEFRATLVGYEGDDALARCKRITAAFVQVGGNQDELVGECRVAVKNLRQRAALAAAADPRAAAVAKEIRARTQAMLRNPTGYEAPRH